MAVPWRVADRLNGKNGFGCRILVGFEGAGFDFPFPHVLTRGNTIRYTRTFEIKELSVPVSKADDLKKFYRIIASDERSTAVLKPAASH